jgi:hypothetical protein
MPGMDGVDERVRMLGADGTGKSVPPVANALLPTRGRVIGACRDASLPRVRACPQLREPAQARARAYGARVERAGGARS